MWRRTSQKRGNDEDWNIPGVVTPCRAMVADHHHAPDCDVLIVGSGYGGSFAAKTLARPGAGLAGGKRPEYPSAVFPTASAPCPAMSGCKRSRFMVRAMPTDCSISVNTQMWRCLWATVWVVVRSSMPGWRCSRGGSVPAPALASHYRHHAENPRCLWQAMQEVQAVLQARPFAHAAELRKYQALAVLGQSVGEQAEAVPITVASEDRVSTAGWPRPPAPAVATASPAATWGQKHHAHARAARCRACRCRADHRPDRARYPPCEGTDAQADDGGPCLPAGACAWPRRPPICRPPASAR